MDGLGGGDVEDRPAGVAQALAEVDLVRVDEERGVQPADLGAGLPAHEQRGGVRPVDLAHRVAGALDVAARQPDGAERRGADRGEAERRRLRRAVGAQQAGARRCGPRSGGEGGVQGGRRARPQLGVLVEQQAVAPGGAREQRAVVVRLAAPLRERDHLGAGRMRPRRLGGPVVGRVVEHEHVGRERHARALGGDRVQAALEQRPPGGVDHAVADLDGAHARRIIAAARTSATPRRPRSRRAARASPVKAP